MYEVLFSKRAIKDRELLKSAGLSEKARALCKNLADDPFRNPPPYEKLVGDLSGSYSRRINVQHRLVYEVDKEEHIVYVLRMCPATNENHRGCGVTQEINEIFKYLLCTRRHRYLFRGLPNRHQ